MTTLLTEVGVTVQCEFDSSSSNTCTKIFLSDPVQQLLAWSDLDPEYLGLVGPGIIVSVSGLETGPDPLT